MKNLHDWSLRTIKFDWEAATVEIQVEGFDDSSVLSAEGVADFHVSHNYPWGKSTSINTTAGPTDADGGLQSLNIEMQSGDLIVIKARLFALT